MKLQSIDVNDPVVRGMRLLVYRVLRETGMLTDLKLASDGHENVGKIACRDDRSFMTEASWIEELHQRHNRKLSVMPLPMFGGAMRFSPYCPEMPDDFLGFKSSPNVYHCEVTIEAIRAGIKFRSNRLLKAGGHGLFCGWASALGLGMYQHARLSIHGRNVLKERSRRERWVRGDNEFEVFAAHHMDCCRDGHARALTYGLNREHPTVPRYTMEFVMDRMDDRRFLELEAPDVLKAFLKEHNLD